jgi:ABC-type transporter MlaC component
MHMHKLAKYFAVAAISVAADLPAQAQSESSTQSAPAAQTAPAETAVTPQPPAKIEATAKSDPETESKTKPSAQTSPAIDDFVAKLDSATRAIHEDSKKDAALVREGCGALLSEILDLDAMTRAANVEIWEKMTPEQRDLFRAAFEHRMIENCVRQFGTYEGESLNLAGVRKADDGQLLATVRVGMQDDAKLVTWRLHNLGPHNWRAVDVISEGRSAVTDAKIEYAAVLQSVNGDIEALIAFMRK